MIDYIKRHTKEIDGWRNAPCYWHPRDKESQTTLEWAMSANAGFASAVQSIQEPLTEEGVEACYREDLYKGAVATLLLLGRHTIPRSVDLRGASEFGLFATSKKDTVRGQLKAWKHLLENGPLEQAFYSSAGARFRGRQPQGVESSTIAALPPWELLHFLGYDMKPVDRPPAYSKNVHCALLNVIGSPDAPRWYRQHDDYGLVADWFEMDLIYLDYCRRLKEIALECTLPSPSRLADFLRDNWTLAQDELM